MPEAHAEDRQAAGEATERLHRDARGLGRPGPGEITSRVGAMRFDLVHGDRVVADDLTSAPSSPSRCARFQVNES